MRLLFSIAGLLAWFCVSAMAQKTPVMVSTNTVFAQGDLFIWSGSAWVTLNRGTNGQVLTATGSSVTWSNAAAGGGAGLVTSVSEDFEVDAGELSITNVLGTGPLVRQSAASGVGTVTSVGTASAVSGLSFSNSPITGSGTMTLTGVVAVASGGTGATNAADARENLGVLSSRWTVGSGTPTNYSGGTGSYYVNIDTYQVWEQTDESTWATIPFFVMGEGVYSYLTQNNTFTATNIFNSEVRFNSTVSNNASLFLGTTNVAVELANKQPLDSDLTAVAGLASSGLVARTGSGTVAARTITGDTEAVVSNGDGVSGNPTLSIGAAIARTADHLTEAEASALYQRTNSILTQLQGLTGGTAGQIITATGSGTFALSNAPSGGDGSWDGTPIASGTVTNFTNIVFWQRGISSSNIFRPHRKRLVLFEKDWIVSSPANSGLPELNGGAIASGTIATTTDETNHIGLVRLASSTSANSGYQITSVSGQTFAQPYLTWESITRIKATNEGARLGVGFTDSSTASSPVDAIRLWRSNNLVLPQIYANSVLTQGYEYPVGSNQFLYAYIQVAPGTASVTFYAEDSDTGTLILSTNISATLPASPGRYFGAGVVGVHTNTVSQTLEDIDWMTAYVDYGVSR